MQQQQKALIVACKEFFGFHPGQTLLEFKAEISQLTQADREELSVMLSKELGIEVRPGPATAQ